MLFEIFICGKYIKFSNSIFVAKIPFNNYKVKPKPDRSVLILKSNSPAIENEGKICRKDKDISYSGAVKDDMPLTKTTKQGPNETLSHKRIQYFLNFFKTAV
jgi:hypothetical protein